MKIQTCFFYGQRALFLTLTGIFLSSCVSSPWKKELSDESIVRIEQNIEKAGDNAPELRKALDEAPPAQKKAVAFLLEWMPEKDISTLTADFILENVAWAYKARENFQWCKDLPEDIFFNEILPYANLQEDRDLWRPDFYSRFEPYVRDCKDIRAAIDSVNLNIRDELMVDYNTKRSRVDISPFQAIKEQMATCTGLSFLLVAAFRSVGIPARFAGTPMWTNMKGNHSWVEVWVDGEWYFTEYYPDALNKSWFVADAGRADPAQPRHWIYAVSYTPGDCYFPMSWRMNDSLVYAWNVTDRYLSLYQEQLKNQTLSEDELLIRIVIFKSGTQGKQSGDRIHCKLAVDQNGENIDFGYTPSPTEDMNKFLIFRLKKNQIYTLTAMDESGKPLREWELLTSDRDQMDFRLEL